MVEPPPCPGHELCITHVATSFHRPLRVSHHLASISTVGYHSALFFQTKGRAKIVAIAERDGYIYKESGIDIAALKQHFDEEGTVLGFDGAETHVRVERKGVENREE